MVNAIGDWKRKEDSFTNLFDYYSQVDLGNKDKHGYFLYQFMCYIYCDS